LIAAVRLNEVDAPLVFPGATDTLTFQCYVDRALVPALRNGDLVVFDNLNNHLSASVLASIRRPRARVLLLPPYSPDYKPIEKMW
jgi:DDE superfamily endonuclease